LVIYEPGYLSGVALGSGLDDGDSSPGRGWEFFSSPPRLDRHWGTPSPFQWVPGALSLGVKRPWREAIHLLPQYAFMVWYSVKKEAQDTSYIEPNEVRCERCIGVDVRANGRGIF
jgi:hypothetical protein